MLILIDSLSIGLSLKGEGRKQTFGIKAVKARLPLWGM
jgi:hypothetical protein